MNGVAHCYHPLILSLVGDAVGRDMPASERAARQIPFASLQGFLCNVSVLSSMKINHNDGSVEDKLIKY